MFTLAILLIIAGYGLGYWDGAHNRAPDPLRGTYDSGEHTDRVGDYPEDWS